MSLLFCQKVDLVDRAYDTQLPEIVAFNIMTENGCMNLVASKSNFYNIPTYMITYVVVTTVV